MIRRPPGSTRTDTLFPYTTLFRSHGDFASNIAMMLAKPAGLKPRDLAEKLIAALPQDAQISKVEIAGPGFLNFFQNSDALAERLEAALADPQLAVRKASAPQRVVIDLSSPNLAKEMHVGHLRSTIIGYAVGRVLEHLRSEEHTSELQSLMRIS